LHAALPKYAIAQVVLFAAVAHQLQATELGSHEPHLGPGHPGYNMDVLTLSYSLDFGVKSASATLHITFLLMLTVVLVC